MMMRYRYKRHLDLSPGSGYICFLGRLSCAYTCDMQWVLTHSELNVCFNHNSLDFNVYSHNPDIFKCLAIGHPDNA
jgi:hypothetical protein